ncbi:hypothetical protein, conserved [Babesia bigemina]|uniref:C3H1-type domain-containing protein n=1 Tax=Babesia bigemina TaxID=5866 RepID=A0A061BSD8_BABBI|nr:hypothetical protein, conserved [Babesia bigemina]CDR71456.1 hypothetical protein, conserved [Babesia bigemina]|eukprot:XP_012770404.1 hypothetical protein, conserved [Babesia bigemina]
MEFKSLKDSVKEKVLNRVHEMGNEIERQFNAQIEKPIKNVDIELKKVKTDLHGWIQKAEGAVNAVIWRCDQVLEKVKEKSPGPMKTPIGMAAEKLQSEALRLRDAAEQTVSAVKVKVENAEFQLKILNNSLKKDLANVKWEIMKKITGVKTAIGYLHNTVTGNVGLVDVKNKKIEKVIEHIKNAVEGIKGHVGDSKKPEYNNPKDVSIYYNWDDIRETIGDYVAKIKGEKGKGALHNTEGLTQIVTGIGEYAKAFGAYLESQVHSKWLNEIVEEKDGALNNQIYSYVYSKSEISGVGHNEKAAKVKRAIKSALPGVINGLIEQVAMESGVKSATTEDIANTYKTFVEEIKNKIADDSLVKAAVLLVEGELGVGNSNPDTPTYNALKYVLYTILKSLENSIQRIASEINKFADDAKIATLNTIIANVDRIREQVDNRRKLDYEKYLGHKIDTALKAAHEKIKTLHDNLGVALDPGSTDDNPSNAKLVDQAIDCMKETLDTQLPWYASSHVDTGFPLLQNGEVSLQTLTTYENAKDGTGVRKTLETAIKDIEDKGLRKLELIGRNPSPGVNMIDEQTFTSQVTIVKEQLAVLAGLVKRGEGTKPAGNDENGMQDYLQDLKELFGDREHKLTTTGFKGSTVKGLEKIWKHALTILGNDANDSKPNTLSTIIHKATNFYTSVIAPAATETINGIKVFIEEQVAAKINSIQETARTVYYLKITDMFHTMRNRVTTNINTINEKIAENLSTGVKGLFKNMHTHKTIIDTVASKSDFVPASIQFCPFLTKLIDYVNGDVKKIDENFGRISNLNIHVKNLFLGLSEFKHFNNEVSLRLSTLSSATSALDPQALPDAGRPVLRALQQGMMGFVGELGKGYVNRYDGGESIKEWVKRDGEKDVLTPEGKNGAKVFLTLLEILGHDLTMLRNECKLNWKKQKVCLKKSNGNRYELGRFLKDCGYGVPSQEGKQDDELKWKDEWTSEKIVSRLETVIKAAETVTHLQKCETNLNEHRTPKKTNNIDIFDIIECIMSHLKEYYRVGHLATLNAKKHPLSIYDMLQWLTGIPNNPVYVDLSADGFDSLFDKPKADSTDTEDGDITVDPNVESLNTYKETITPVLLSGVLTEVCAQSHSVLTAVLGHGHAGGRYACEFNTNTDGFMYPSDMNALICMMFEIAKRLHHQLYFLYRQCHDGTDLSGWSDCWYGNSIAGSSWKCNTIQCPNQTSNQMENQKHNQSCDQKCNQTANCGLKSPLQSYLEDGLHGFLPHQLKVERGQLVCSVKHSNMPCKTPMGFADISYMASHRQQGKHLKEVLFDFCSEEWSALSRLCGILNCLLPSAPKTLQDMFGFYNTFLSGWSKTVEREFNKAASEANFNRDNASLEIRPIFSSSDHGESNNMPHLKGDLYSLVNCKYSTNAHPAYPCGPYLRPMCYYSCGIFAAKHNDKYLSWIVYLTETFHNLLEQLYNDCCKNCGSSTSKCRVSKCADGCGAKAKPDNLVATHKETCNSIVHCKLMRPTLFRYGFVYRNIRSLSGVDTVQAKRTCKDFCDALEKVINKQEKLHRALAELVYRTIPNYLFQIRFPFMTLTLSLWLLSLLYLLHIMVIRLDLLHIKSHLHSPSSHRIAAQSLLAAARVNKLNRVFYLQP